MPEPARELRPLDTPAAPVVAVGTALFAVALVVLLLAGGPASWRWICVCGIGLGLVGLPVAARMQRRD